MKIGIDAHILGKNKGGVEVYLRNLITQLAFSDASNEYYIYLNRTYKFDEKQTFRKETHFKNLAFSSPWLRHVGLLPFVYRYDSLDALHVQRIIPLGLKKAKTILSVHDIAQHIYPQYFDSGNNLIIKNLITSSIVHAHSIIVSSEVNKQDILNHFDVPENKITVIYPGIQKLNSVSQEKIEEVLTVFGIKRPYLLFIGAIEPRKNVHGLIEMSRMLKDSGFSGSVVSLGGLRPGTIKSYYPSLLTHINQYGMKDFFHFLGYQSDQIKEALLHGAFGFIYPSFYEGFGMPLLEAMSAGVPVIASKIPVFTEIGSDACLFAKAEEPKDFFTQIKNLLNDKELYRTLQEKGKKWASSFTWDECARKHKKVYESILGD